MARETKTRCVSGGHVGTYEAALILGVERSRLAKWLMENEHGKDSIEEPIDRLRCGPIWTRAQIDRKLRSLYLAEGRPGHEDTTTDAQAEEAFQTWARKRQTARARRDGVKPAELEQILSPEPVAVAA